MSALDDARCTNRIAPSRSRGYYRRCQRDSTGTDGLCNICRAAKRRSEEHREREDREQAARWERSRRASQQAREREWAAGWIQEHYPELWKEALNARTNLERGTG